MEKLFWTEERVEQLKQMRADGKSNTVIGAALGATRNAVAGKISRMGLPLKSKKQSHVAVRPRVAKLCIAEKIMKQEPKCELPVEIDLPEGMHDHLVMPGSDPDRPPIPFDELRPDSCRWPIGRLEDKATRFCGCEQVLGSAYCAVHHQIATRPLPERGWLSNNRVLGS